MEEVATTYVKRRQNGVYYYRRRIPNDCLEALKDKHPQGEIKQSLHTRNEKEAHADGRLLAVQHDQYFAEVRRQIEATKPKPRQHLRSLSSISKQELERLAVLWFYKELDKMIGEAAKYSKKGLKEYERENLKDSIQIEQYAWGTTRDPQEVFYRTNETSKIARDLLENSNIHDIEPEKLELLQDYVLRGKQELVRQMESVLIKQWGKTTIKDTLFANMAAANAKPKMTLGELVSLYKSNAHATHNKREKTRYEDSSKLNTLLEFFGDSHPAEDIKNEDVARYIEALDNRPLNPGKRYKNKTFTELLELGRSGAVKTLQPKTVNRYIGAASTLFGWAKQTEKLSHNPFFIRSLKTADTQKKRRPFSKEQITHIFSSDAYRQEFSRKTTSDSFRWIPLIALFTGMRLSEICQLYCSDIEQEEGVDYIQVKGAVSPETGEQRVKSRSSIRRIPIHSELKKCGFMAFVEQARAKGQTRLFPDATVSKERRTDYKNVSRWFGKYLERIGIKDEKTPYSLHCFRHNFADALRHGGVDLDMRELLGGWTPDRRSTDPNYGDGHLIIRLQIEIEKMKYAGVDLSHLHMR